MRIFGWLPALFAALSMTSPAQRAPLFKNEIQPVLERNCVSCHGSERKMAGLDLSSFTGLMAGGSGGPAISPGHPERSLLWRMIEGGKMPVGGTLTAAEKQLIRTYIEQGRFPSMETAAKAREAARITPEARNWWAFRKPVKPALPKSGEANPIDAFIASKLAGKGWKLSPEADRVTLIRRASFDLIGLPPAPAEVRAFVEDGEPLDWWR